MENENTESWLPEELLANELVYCVNLVFCIRSTPRLFRWNNERIEWAEPTRWPWQKKKWKKIPEPWK